MGKETVLPKNIRQIGDIQGTDRICLEDYVTTYIRKKETQEDQGYLGIFLGEEKTEEDYRYVFIRGILEVPKTEMEDAELLDYLKTECEKYFPGYTIQGCCVIGTYPATKMEKLTTLIPEAGNLLYHLQEQEESLYRLSDGQYSRIRGYFIYYEQNQEMQEYLAQSFQEEHTEKETLPDNAIKTFREKVKEKGLQKNSSFLRLAGSFLVLTVLAVGAIAVNRVDEIRAIRSLSEDRTMENEAFDEELEDIPVLKEWNEVNTVEYVTDSVSEFSDEPIGLENSAEVLNEEVINEDTALPGSDAFWNDTNTEIQNENSSVVTEINTDRTGTDMTERNTDEAAEINTSRTNTDVTEITTDEADETAAKINTNEADETGAAVEKKNTDGEVTEMNTDETEAAVQTSSRQIQSVYIIRAGDTLADICNKYYGSLQQLEEICRVNEISDANLVMPGQKIVLP